MRKMSSTTLETGVQYGFYFNQARCVGCNACEISCKNWNELGAGPTKWARIIKWYTGSYPTITSNLLFAPCYHCENPVCVQAANGAMFKEANYGVVLIDPSKATSGSLRDAWEACPYGAISFDSDEPNATATKCDMCIDRLSQNMLPICVLSCPMRALDFGKLSDLQTKYGTNDQLPGMPTPSTTPAVVFKVTDPQKTLVPYDVPTALALQGTSPDGQTVIYSTTADLSNAGSLLVRNNPNFHPKSSAESMYFTGDDRS
jgi:anaerobic dimethyl sulfoxide reductase subunit B